MAKIFRLVSDRNRKNNWDLSMPVSHLHLTIDLYNYFKY